MPSLKHVQNFDHRLFYLCTSSGEKIGFCNAVKLISKTGDGYLQVLLPLMLAFFVEGTGYLFLEIAAMSFLYERIAYFVLKNTCKRQRPPEKLTNFRSLVVASDKFSFPSGHTSAAFLLTTLIVVTFGPAFLWMYLWAAAVGASRVILGVHFPTDILAGATLGSVIALFLAPAIG